jgi:dolichol-phosphate mannosyltransferase
MGCLLARLLTPVRDVTSGFFVARREAIEDAAVSAPGFKICLELLVRGRVRSIVEVPYVFTDRAAGQSKMTFIEALHYFVQLKDLYLLRWRTRRDVLSVQHEPLSPEDVAHLGRPPLALR